MIKWSHAPYLWGNLWKFGGFPEPFLKAEEVFCNRWQNLKHEQLFREDLRDLNKVSEVSRCEILAEILRVQAGQLVNFSILAKKIQVANTTIRRWVDVLELLYYCFLIRPWTKNIARSLLKEPKCYLWDFSLVENKGQRFENFVALHLLKAVHYWTDTGLGNYKLYYLRDKEQREVDFLISKNDEPWMLVEAKLSGNTHISKSLLHFQKQLNAKHVFQVAFDLPYVNKDCFKLKKPMIVPAKTLLSQLV
ncbi:MAG: DUF4143 domain-containing protein [Gammaproteobacteria bacterium]|nr:DUF4143 domain-containing protein [Gammaproteobacteria bacterium]